MLCGTFILAACLAAAATAQERGKGGFRGGGFGALGGGSSLLMIASSEAVQKDVGLSADAVTKLNSLRDDAQAARRKELQNAGINPQDFQSLTPEQRRKMADIQRSVDNEFNPKVKEIVGADSYKRLKQIELQANLRMRGPGALTYSDVASELKLTDDQKKKLDDLQTEFDRRQRELFSGGQVDQQAAGKLREERTPKTMEALTAEQKETLNKLKGPEFDVSQIGFGFGGRRGKGN